MKSRSWVSSSSKPAQWFTLQSRQEMKANFSATAAFSAARCACGQQGWRRREAVVVGGAGIQAHDLVAHRVIPVGFGADGVVDQ